MIRKLILTAFLATGFSLPAIAATPGISGGFGDGAVIVGPNSNSCSTGIQGAIRYTSTGGLLAYCDGSNWVSIGGGGTPASPDRGIQFNSGNGFTAASTFIFTSAGKLGIGTATPSEMISLNAPNGGDVVGIKMQAGGTSGPWSIGRFASNDLQISSISTIQMMSPTGIMGGYNDPTNALGVGASASIGAGYYSTAAPTNGLIVQGNVGIGTASPATKVDVVGTLRVGDGGETCSGTTAGAIRYTSVNTLQFCNGTGWSSVIPACTTFPDNFSFSNVTGATASTVTPSTIQQITNISCTSSPVSISGGSSSQFQICSDSGCSSVITSWTSTASTIQNNQYLQIRQTSSASSLGVVTATITVGGQARNWSVTTQDLGTFKYVFITSTTTMGNFGGVAGADSICAARASAGGLGGTWKAWLASTGADDPATRFTHASVPYRLLDGTLIATNWTDLTDGTLSNTILRDEFGANNGYSADWVWSNVQTSGVAQNTTNCTSWTVNGSGVNGNQGDPAATTSQWTDRQTSSADYACNTTNHHLYCFQQ